MSKRLLKDLQAIKNDEEWHFTATPNESDISKITATFPGPVNSPYENGLFVVQLEVPPEYPLKPPRAKFETRVFHPNISSQTGAICLDILQNKWTPVYSILSILISLQQLLDSPNPADPQDAEVAKVYTQDYAKFVEIAKEWTAKYAKSNEDDGVDPKTVEQFTQMGFSKEKVVDAMKKLGVKTANTEEEKSKILESIV